MDPMKQENDEITLRSGIDKDISVLDEYFEDVDIPMNIKRAWNEVREAAISFAETIDKINPFKWT